MNHYSRFQKTNPKKNSNSNSNPSHSNTSHMRLRTSRNPILNPQNSKNINQIHLATKKSIKNTQILRTNRIENPSNLRSKAKKIESSTCHASSVRWKSCSHRSACIRNVSSGWWYSAFRASFTVFWSSIFWTHKINQNQTSWYSI